MIAGTGVHGLEMAEIVERVNRVTPTWNLLGFISSDGAGAGTIRHGYPIVGGPEALADHSLSQAALIPDNEWPRSLPLPCERLGALIDPSAFVSRTARITPGCVLYPNCFVGVNAVLGERVFCLSACVINHDCLLDDNVILASGVTLAGSVHVQADCYLGQSCTVRQHLRIGRGSLIGMGAVVIRDVPSGSVVVGNPGRILRQR